MSVNSGPTPKLTRYPTFKSQATQMWSDFTGQERRTRKRSMFIDAEEMKEKVRSNLHRPVYNVQDFYHDTGLFQAIARHPVFEYVTLFIIFLNGVWIAYDTDANTADSLVHADIGFQIVEHSFCFFFTCELFIRFMAFKKKSAGPKDAWFVFDTFLVCLMVAETWVLTVVILIIGGDSKSPLGNASVLRLFRLMRLSRMARMLRSMPELMILIKGMVAGFRSVFFTLCLLFVQIYVFSIALRQLTDGSVVGGVYFESIPVSMYNLLMIGTFLEDLKPTVDELGGPDGHPVFAFMFLLFVSVAALMIMNMLIGVLCEVVTAIASSEKEEMAVNFVRTKMYALVENMDENYDNCISRVEFEKILANRQAVKILHDIGVDPISLVDLTDHLFKDDSSCLNFEDDDGESEPGDRTLEFGEFMEMILKLRGCNTATVKDIQNLSKTLKAEIRRYGSKSKKKRNPNGRATGKTIAHHQSIFSNVSPRLQKSLPHAFTEDSIRTTAIARPLQEAWAAPLTVQTDEIQEIHAYDTDGTGACPTVAFRSKDDESQIRQKTEKVEAWLIAAQSELRKLRCPDLPGAIANSHLPPSLCSWASKLEDTISTGLSELQRLQGYS